MVSEKCRRDNARGTSARGDNQREAGPVFLITNDYRSFSSYIKSSDFIYVLNHPTFCGL